VTNNSPITVPAGSFPRGFQIRSSWHDLNDYGEAVTWIVPKVGIVDLKRREYGFFNAYFTWRLIDYSIVPAA
jgi:hypothetical protein